MISGYPVVWVESPLQFVSAAELAAERGVRMRVVFRLGPQMPETAAELLARGANFAACIPYLGIPWNELARASEWIVGDGLSGQFRLAAAVLRPKAVTLLDDGTMSLHLAAALAGQCAFERPEQRPSGLRGLLGDLARDHLLRLAARGSLVFFSVFGTERAEFRAAAALGVRLRANRFVWTRRSARPPRLPGNHVLLGTARVADGLLDRAEHLAEVARFAASGGAVYLPHRREPAQEVDAIRSIPGVTVIEPGLPVELFLAGLDGLEIRSSGSSADSTLAHVLNPPRSVERSG
ncbi:hypothetical protein [Pseudolysinimonas sp.]|uniref:hypothetical protein n=1 Tax=Pseudolysinimonas sp. TaxID=2680009 RepID=UPI00286B3DC0|nr:hypothetical protein [Pseudolysinimonas sp.]